MAVVHGIEVDVRQQARKSMALRATPGGLVALIPRGMDPESDTVRRFIERGLARLPEPQLAEPITGDALRALVDAWADRLGVSIARVQIRKMRNKWASCSSQGTITLNTQVLGLPRELVDYIVVHELLHLRFPGHRKGWQAMMGVYVPDWRELDLQLPAWSLSHPRRTNL